MSILIPTPAGHNHTTEVFKRTLAEAMDGADVVLVGEALVTNDPVSTLHAFLAAGDVPAGELAAEDVTAEEGASR